ncbi:hypothetical protein ACSQ67_007861 [Phaseolus vulgaris]
MRPQNIDHNLHISPPRSNEPPITPNSNRQIQFEQAPIPLIMVVTNPIHGRTHQQQTTRYMILRMSLDPSQNVTRFQLTMPDGVHATFLCSEIPEHVQNHVVEFRRQLSSSSPTYPLSQNRALGGSISPQTRCPSPLTRHRNSSHLSHMEKLASSTFESQIQMGDATASPSMNVDEEIDLELRLGRSR